MQDQPFQVLRMLLEHQGEIVTREELRERLWSADTFVDFNDGLNTAVKKIRDMLGDSAEQPRYIETIPRRGYRFLMPVHVGSSTCRVSSYSQATRRLKPLTGVVVVTILLAGVLLLWRNLTRPPELPQLRAIAVLPLENLSGDTSQDYFAAGLTDALTTELARTAGTSMRVTSRKSAEKYRNKPLAQIVRDLNVDAVIEGSVVRSGNHVRITAQLVEARADKHVWAESYDRDLRDVIALETEIAGTIARQVQLTLSPESKAHLASHRMANPEAYDLYLRGSSHVGPENEPDNRAAIDLLQRSLSIDSSFAPAYAALALAYRTRAANLDRDPQWEEKGFAAVQKALELDPNLPEAYAARGYLLWLPVNHYPHERAALDFHHALKLNPNLAEAHARLAQLYNHIGVLDKAAAEQQKASELDPVNASASWSGGINLLYTGNYEQAFESLRDAKRYMPPLWAFQTSFALFHLGRKEEAADRIDESLKANPRDTGGVLAGMRALLAADTGDDRRAEAEIQRAIKLGEGYEHFHHTEYIIASAYALMNKHDSALHWLRRAADDGFPCYPLYEQDNDLNNLRKDSHFQQFMIELKNRWEHYRAI